MQRSIGENTKLNTIVIDITYLCNATCKYCQWGSDKTPGRVNMESDKILIKPEMLKNLNTKRIVISGGEPRLHPELEKIVQYYSKYVQDIIIITNGYGLTILEVKNLLRMGITGFTISLDSIDSTESFLTRSTPTQLHKKILENIKEISTIHHNFEFSINSTVSHVTANWRTVKNILEFATNLDLDCVKFQPIFDDGYVKRNAPELRLSPHDVKPLLEIASNIDNIHYLPTNPPGFWSDVAHISNGNTLPACNCSLDPSESISVNGNLSMCYWVNSSSYGASSDIISKDDILKVQKNFVQEKKKCNVDFHCFCNQGIDHIWMK